MWYRLHVADLEARCADTGAKTAAASLNSSIDAPPAVSFAEAREEITQGLATRTILLVEDDSVAAKWLRFALEARGFRVIWATRIEQARKLALEHELDAALLDLELPDGNGFDLIVELRTRPAPCAVVVVTGHTGADQARTAAGLGVTEFLGKPFRRERVLQAVDRALERSSRMREFCFTYATGQPADELCNQVSQRLAPSNEVEADEEIDPERVRQGRLAKIRAIAREFALSDRQAQAICGVAEGLSDTDLAKSLGVSYGRARQLLRGAFNKLGLKSRNDFIRFLWERDG